MSIPAGEILQAVRNHTADLDGPRQRRLQRMPISHRHPGPRAAACRVRPGDLAAFLRSLGIVERTASLLKNARPEQAGTLQTATDRLIDPAAMGNLFGCL